MNGGAVADHHGHLARVKLLASTYFVAGGIE